MNAAVDKGYGERGRLKRDNSLGGEEEYDGRDNVQKWNVNLTILGYKPRSVTGRNGFDVNRKAQ